MAAILSDSAAVVVVVVRTLPRAIPLAKITMKKSIPECPLLPSIDMVLRCYELRRNFEKENLQAWNIVKMFFSKLPLINMPG